MNRRDDSYEREREPSHYSREEDSRDFDTRREFRSERGYDQDRSQFNRPSRSNFGQVEGDYREDERRMDSRDYRDFDEDNEREYGMRDRRDWDRSDDTGAYQEALREGSRRGRRDKEEEDYSRRSSRRGNRSSQNARH